MCVIGVCVDKRVNVIVGERYRGRVNRAIIQVVKIVNPKSRVLHGKEPDVLYKDCKTGKLFTCGMETFKRCDLERLEV